MVLDLLSYLTRRPADHAHHVEH